LTSLHGDSGSIESKMLVLVTGIEHSGSFCVFVVDGTVTTTNSSGTGAANV
jgi:hypothetical protein